MEDSVEGCLQPEHILHRIHLTTHTQAFLWDSSSVNSQRKGLKNRRRRKPQSKRRTRRTIHSSV
jgi:hypothetical protein